MINIKIALCGYSGKTGKAVYEELLNNNYDVIGVDMNSKPLSNYINSVDLVIDFTNKNAALNHIDICLHHHKPFICATTGFTSIELAQIKSRCNIEKVKGVICYNFSLPLNQLLKHFAFFNQYFEEFTYLDIHHVSKLDKVSGTTYLFMIKNNKFKIKSYRTKNNMITYVLIMATKHDKMTISYQVFDKKVFALGLIEYLKNPKDENIINLIA